MTRKLHLALVVLSSLVFAQEPAAPPSVTEIANFETMMAPISSLEQGDDAQLILLNNTPRILAVDPQLYSVGGQRIETSQIVLQPNEMKETRISALLKKPTSQSNLGGIILTYQGKRTSLGAELIVLPRASRGSVNVTFSGSYEYKSEVQNGVWWMPEDGRAFISLFNSSDSEIDVEISSSAGPSKRLKIDSHAVRNVNLQKNAKNDHYMADRLCSPAKPSFST